METIILLLKLVLPVLFIAYLIRAGRRAPLTFTEGEKDAMRRSKAFDEYLKGRPCRRDEDPNYIPEWKKKSNRS